MNMSKMMETFPIAHRWNPIILSKEGKNWCLFWMIDSIMKPKFRIRQLWNRFATRNQWFNEATEMMRTSVLSS
jgi:hypothetical protein